MPNERLRLRAPTQSLGSGGLNAQAVAALLLDVCRWRVAASFRCGGITRGAVGRGQRTAITCLFSSRYRIPLQSELAEGEDVRQQLDDAYGQLEAMNNEVWA